MARQKGSRQFHDQPAAPCVPQHNRSLPYGEMVDVLAIVDASRAWVATKLAVAFVAHTAGGSGEVRGATWAEIDKDAAV